MATLKEHQAAMVDLLANGSGIPASASRLAHAMHDLLGVVMLQSAARDNAADIRALFGMDDATTPGLNDKALSKPQKPLKTDSPAKWPNVAVKPPVSADNRVKELENTIRQLKANNRALRQDYTEIQVDRDRLQTMLHNLQHELGKWRAVEADLVRATTAENRTEEFNWLSNARDIALGYIQPPEPEQAGCRREDTQVCEHAWASLTRADQLECLHCGVIKQ